MADSSTKSGGVGFFTLLGLLFIGLKLGKVINWTWPIVLLPLWGPLAFVLGILLIVALLWVVIGDHK